MSTRSYHGGGSAFKKTKQNKRKATRRAPKTAEVQTSTSSPATPVLLPRACRRLLLLQDPAGPIEVARGRRPEAPQLPDGLAHGAGVLGEALDVLEGQVDDLVAAGVAVQVSAGEALEAGLVGDAALAVRQVGPQRQGAGQGAALQAPGLAGALLGGRPEEEEEQS